MIETGLQSPPPARERELRRRLGIPREARQVIIFAESSHWDPNWLYTSEEYYERFVGHNLNQAVEELLREPLRVYSVESVFFLRMFWEREPGQRHNLRALIDSGRMRMTSSGVTTADTIVPTTEAILRDLLIGQEWLRAHGMQQEPRLAYFADSFGCSPALPSLLNAAGFGQTAITRIDGMYFAGCDYESKRFFPRPGSSAALLAKVEKSLDFVWRDRDGGEVLAHWNACTYGQGDLLASRGFSRVYLFPVSFSDRSDRNVARRVAQFAAQLAPYSRTPYLFCPIGFDFVPPIRGLVGLLERYNRNHYPRTGLWAVNAGLDDYLDLIDCYRDRLPVLALDPNPYWTGFYSARPTLKRECHRLVDLLLLAERLAVARDWIPGERTEEQKTPDPQDVNGREMIGELEEAWYDAAVANHHDFITGTAPDPIVRREQRPWVERATAAAVTAIGRLVPSLRPGAGALPAELPEWRSRDGLVEVRTPHYILELAEEAGGSISRAWDPRTGEALLAGPSNDLVSYRDHGGLWRMGYEFRGGVWRERLRASDGPARLEVLEHPGGLEIACELDFDGHLVRRLIWLRADSPLIRMRVEGRAAERRTVTVRFETGIRASRLVMDQAGGIVVRPPRRVYDPTFWPLQSFLFFRNSRNSRNSHDSHDSSYDGDKGEDRGMALGLAVPGAASYEPEGRLELIVLRNAIRELAYGLFSFPGLPSVGRERRTHSIDYAIWFTAGGDWSRNDVGATARSVAESPWEAAQLGILRRWAAALVVSDRPDVLVSAVKPASRGEGVVVRLTTFTAVGQPVRVSVPGRTLRAARLCDVRERDLQPLEVEDDSTRLVMPGTIASVRLIV